MEKINNMKTSFLTRAMHLIFRRRLDSIAFRCYNAKISKNLCFNQLKDGGYISSVTVIIQPITYNEFIGHGKTQVVNIKGIDSGLGLVEQRSYFQRSRL